jgi:hypothetical protein
MFPQLDRMRPLFVIAVISIAASPWCVAAEDVPLPKPRPASLAERFPNMPRAVEPSQTTSLAPAPELHNLPFGDSSPSPSPCDLRLTELAEFTPMPAQVGPGECGAADVVRLNAVTLRDRLRVPLNPPAVLRCGMAEALAHFIRNDVAPAAAELGAPLASIVNYDSYDCRGRNRVIGAKISEHGKGNAIDIRGIRLANGTMVELTSPVVAKDFRDRMRIAACGRFSTVLGPGSDGYHESHIHFDLAERSRGYKMCQWEVREPPVAVNVPLPPPRPSARAADAPIEE